MATRRRLLWFIPLVLIAAAVVYTVWLADQVQGSLTDAESSASRLQRAIDIQDPHSRDAAVASLRSNAADAAARTDGLWWSALTYLPMVGDDATGVRAISRSLDTISRSGVRPLSDSVDRLDKITAGGQIHVDVVRSLQAPVRQASEAFTDADAEVSGLDSSGYAGALKTRFDKYAALVDRTAGALSSAETATRVLPTMVGGDGPRNYLMVFQNNAEIRATGGLPGSWALVHAEGGKLTLVRQGTAGQFGERAKPLPLSTGELTMYGPQLGTYFQDAGFTPDFPRAAGLMATRWQETFPATHLDGVLALDPVGMSYLLEGTGPVQVGDVTLTSANVVDELLSRPYRELEPTAQDTLFAQAAHAIFDASTADLKSPLAFVEGLNRAAREGRFLVAPFDETVKQDLAGTRVEGALAGDDGATPHVDIGLNDGTGSKMSYYLRYWADVKATGCSSGVQTLSGSLTLNQKIAPSEAAKLPDSVTGGGRYGSQPGTQLVHVRLYAPYHGTVDSVSINGRSLGKDLHLVDLDGRPVKYVGAILSSQKDVVITWTMHTAKGQTSDVQLGMTPSIVPGNNDATVRSAC